MLLPKNELLHLRMGLAVIWGILVTGCRDVHADEFAANLPAGVRGEWDVGARALKSREPGLR